MQTRVAALIMVGMVGCTHRAPPPAGRQWDSRTATFAWSSGEIKLPPGFAHHADPGDDSFEGHFTSRDERVTVRYDIGAYAGCWASRQRALAFSETVVDGFRVLTAKRELPDGRGSRAVLVAATFPEAECANFFLESANEADAKIIDYIAQSFRGKGHPLSAGDLCSDKRP
jgi:hypothetical protein